MVYLKTEGFKSILTELVEKTKAGYEKNMFRRALANTVVLGMILKLSSDEIAKAVQKKIIEYFNAFKQEDNSDRKKFKQWIYIKIDEVKGNNKLKEKLEDIKMQQIESLNLEPRAVVLLNYAFKVILRQ
jgi:uncharacterized membrane protein